MNVKMIEEVVSQKKKQGQKLGILCYDSPTIGQKVKDLSSQPDYLYLFERSGANEDCLKKIKTDKPDFLLVFVSTGGESLVDITTFIYDWGAKHILINNEATYLSRDIKSTIIKIDKEIIFKSIATNIEYPADYSKKVTQYWDCLLESGKIYWDGLMYSVCNVKESSDSLCFEFSKTNYRNTIYSKEHDFRNEFHTCTTASIAIIETSDGYSVLGKMNKESAFSGQYKCVGGALDEKDFIGDRVCFERMFSREIAEEIGIDTSDHNICSSNENKWLLIREEMAFVGLCNVIRLNLSKNELLEIFEKKRRETEDEKEVESLLFIKTMDEINALAKEEKADYVDELYRCYFGLEKGIDWNEYQKNFK